MDMLLKDDRWCFACGSHNPHGLHLEDLHLEGPECVCTFTPERWHQGWADIVHGGITSTLLDEVMTHVLYRRGFDAVTAEMTIRLRKPVPIGERLTVRASISRRRGKLAEVEGELALADGTVAARSSGKFFVTPRERDKPGGPLSLAGRRAVIFDLFGTLAPVFERESYFAARAQMAATLGMDTAQFIKALRADAPGRTIGKWARLEDNVAAIAHDAGLSPSDEAIARATEIRTDYSRQRLLNPYPDALVVLQALTDAGRPIGLISDCSPETPAIWPESPLARFISAPVFSCAVGMRKPDPAIYALACERMGVDPYETVYVGDGDSEELPGAAQVGLRPILVDREEDCAFRVTQCRECEIVLRDLTQLLPLLDVRAPSGPATRGPD